VQEIQEIVEMEVARGFNSADSGVELPQASAHIDAHKSFFKTFK